MNIFQRLLGPKKPAAVVEHPIFGKITYSKHDGWINTSFSAFGYSGIDLLIDAGPEGPTSEQMDAFANLAAKHDSILSESVIGLQSMRAEMSLRLGTFVLSGITIPSYKPELQGRLWTLWFDCPEDDHFMFGVQSDDEWRTLHPFADG
jgi:hypothetical protein